MRDKIVRQAGQQFFEDLVSSDEQGVGMASLGDTFAWFGSRGESVSLDDRYLAVPI